MAAQLGKKGCRALVWVGRAHWAWRRARETVGRGSPPHPLSALRVFTAYGRLAAWAAGGRPAQPPRASTHTAHGEGRGTRTQTTMLGGKSHLSQEAARLYPNAASSRALADDSLSRTVPVSSQFLVGSASAAPSKSSCLRQGEEGPLDLLTGLPHVGRSSNRACDCNQARLTNRPAFCDGRGAATARIANLFGVHVKRNKVGLVWCTSAPSSPSS